MAAFGTTEVRAEESVNIRVDGIDVGTVSSGDGWSYDAAANVLTLDGYVRTYSGENNYGIIEVSMENLTICLKGENCITLNSDANISVVENIVGNITITGDGSFEVVADSDSVGEIGSKNLTIKSGTLKVGGLGAVSDLAIEGGTIQVEAFLRANNTMHISGGTVCAKTSEDVYALGCGQDLYISGGTVSVEGGSVFVSNVYMSGGSAVFTGTSNMISVSGSMMISDGSMVFTSDTGYMYILGKALIAGGTVTVTSGDSGIQTLEGVEITGGEYRFIPKEGAKAAVYAESGNYTFGPNAKISGDGFFATAVVNGELIVFPTNKIVICNEAQNAALDALYVTYGVSDCEELMMQTTFVKDKTGLPVQTVLCAEMVYICNVNGMDVSNGMEFSFPADEIKPGDTVAVFQITYDGELEYIKARAGYGKITGTFTSLSPVFYAEVELEGVDDDNDDDDVTDSESVSASGSESDSDTMSQASGGQQTASGTMKSPETGDSAMPEIMFIILSASIVMLGRLMVKFKV